MTLPINTQDAAVSADLLAENYGEHVAAAIMAGQHPFWKVGENYYIRGGRYSILGTLQYGDDKELVLNPAWYVRNDGRASAAMQEGIENAEGAEVEWMGEQAVNRLAINDATRYKHELPTSNTW